MAEQRCTRVTGKAFEPFYWTLPKGRQGPRRSQDEADMSRVGLNRTRPVWDVLCGDSAEYWVRANDSIEVVYCCGQCLKATIDRAAEQRLGMSVTVGAMDKQQCETTDEFGGRCVYVKGHRLPCRPEGGDEEARHDAALEAYHAERQQRLDEEAEGDDGESFASKMGHPGGHYG